MPRRALLTVLLAAVLLLSIFPLTAVSAQTPMPPVVYLPMVFGPYEPVPSNTYYVLYPARTYYEGCRQGLYDQDRAGGQDSLVILAFGQGWKDAGQWGVWIFNPVFRFSPISESEQAAKDFIRGYWDCKGNDTHSQLTLALGINSYGSYGSESSDVNIRQQYAREHAQAWVAMVNRVGSWVRSQGYRSQVTVAGAKDIEIAWNKFPVTKAWVDQYNSANPGQHLLYNFGSCDGCPTTSSPNWVHSVYLWSQENIWYVSYGAVYNYPIPEIYMNTGVNSSQWYGISRYAALYKGAPIFFPGLLTQQGACQQRGGCIFDSTQRMDIGPLEAYHQFLRKLNSDPLTRQESIRWATDIRWMVNQ